MGIALGGAGAILALAFYAVVGAWTLAYAWKMGIGDLRGASADAAGQAFDGLNASPPTLLAWFTAFIGATVFISARGLHDGVEMAVKVMMPALFVIVVGLTLVQFWSQKRWVHYES